MLSILENHSILYVEDEPSIRSNITEYLKSYFGSVWVGADGAEALTLYQMHHPDVLLLDINLPYMDGLSVAKEIRHTDHTTKIVMLTAHTEKEKLLKATELKLTKYLIKPVSPKDFKETMQLLAEELQQNPSRFVNFTQGYIWDREYERLSREGHSIELTEKNYLLLKHMIAYKNQVITYEDIMVAVWEDSFERDISIDSVKNQVSMLRKKLPEGAIDSIYGKGYRLK
jgi:DNA-binding response OmpR family regulator